METPNNVIKNRCTSEEIREILLQWKQSGLNRRQFCQKHGYNYYTFGTWNEKHGKTEGVSSFTEVKIQSSVPVFARLTFPNGGYVEFYQPLSAEYFQGLLK